MPCRIVQLPGGGFARVHFRGRNAACSICGRREESVLCDGRDVGASDTCDAPMCRRCALHAPGDKDYCPRHVHQARLQRQLPFASQRTSAGEGGQTR